ncbi:MAG: peptidase M16, partial [bacterium]|nr:peptidase M16 [bacterium]
KYPVKEPFVELIKGSLQTFLNAMTFPDKTAYPVASQNVKDLYNLADVYLDAVLYPRISPHIFEQEGWHYELDDPEQPLSFKGVVFNEMKGAYSSPDNVLGRYSKQSLFPDTTYGVDSGGDPTLIPHLTYEQFKSFHESYYHPSNSRIFFYGDDDPEERLRFLDSYLKDFDAIAVPSEIELQTPFEKAKTLTIPYDAGESEPNAKKGMLTVNWLFPEGGDLQTSLAFFILDYILIATQASPLRKALIDSGLGEDLTGGGLSDSLRQMYFSTGLKGISVEDAGKVEELIQRTLTDLVRNGIEPEMIEAAMNTTEFNLRERNTGSFPRGLSLMFDSLTSWLHGKDPIAPLTFEEPLQALKKNIKEDTTFFERMIRRHLLDNSHRTSVLLTPDPEVGKAQKAKEEAALTAVKSAMSPAELKVLVDRSRELKRVQETPDAPEDLAKLPMLTLADLEKKEKLIPLEVFKAQGTEILYHDLFTNGIVYLDLGLNLHGLPQELVPYASLFGKALVKLGTETEDFVKLSQRIGRRTGGVWPSAFNSALPQSDESAVWLFLRGKSTMEQAEDLLAIMRDVLLTVKLDNRERFKQIILESKARKESSLIPAGSASVRTRLGAHFHESGWYSEQSGGVTSLFFVRKLVEEIEHEWPAVLEKLEEVRRIAINRNAMLCNVTLDRTNWEQFQPKLRTMLAEFPAAEFKPAGWQPEALATHEGLTIPAQVNFVAKGANLYKAGYSYHASVAVISHYLRTTWLWEKVRVQGGAYGGFCSFDRRSGIFAYISYRDPNVLKTLENYDLTAQFLRDTELSDDELSKGIIGVVGGLDDYQLPDAKGFTSMLRHLLGESDEFRQKIRDEVLGTTAQDFKNFAEVLQSVAEHGEVVVMGTEDAVQEAGAKGDKQLETLKVL